MCGIFAMTTKGDNGFSVNDMHMLSDMFYLTRLRGQDSTGISVITKEGECKYLKILGTPDKLTEAPEWKDIRDTIYREGKIVFGHCRAATKGTVTLENAHPFVVPKKTERDGDSIVLVHNGTLTTYQDLPGFHEHDVDSKWLATMVGEYGPDEALGKINGAIATIWWDTEKEELHFFRNYERPLGIVIHDGVVLLASEGSTLSWLKARHNLKYEHKDILELNPRAHAWVALGKLHKMKSIKDLEYKEIEKIFPSYRPKNYGKQFGFGFGGYEGLYGDYDDDPVWGVAAPPPAKTTQLPSYSDSLQNDIRLVMCRKVSEVVFEEGVRRTQWLDGEGKYSSVTRDVRAPHIPGLWRISKSAVSNDSYLLTFKGDAHATSVRTEIHTWADAEREKKKKEKAPIKARSVTVTYPAHDDDLPENVKRVNNKKFMWTTFNPKTKTEIVHKAIGGRGNKPYYLSFYENAVDGKFRYNTSIIMEQYTSTPIEINGTTIYKIEGFLLSPIAEETGVTASYIDVYFYCSEEVFIEKIKEHNFFEGMVGSMRFVNKERHKTTGAYVEMSLTSVSVTSLDNEVPPEHLTNLELDIENPAKAVFH